MQREHAPTSRLDRIAAAWTRFAFACKLEIGAEPLHASTCHKAFIAGVSAADNNPAPANDFQTMSRPTIEQAWQEFREDHNQSIGSAGYEGSDPIIASWRACFMSGAAAAISSLGINAAKITQPDTVTVTYDDLNAATWRLTNRGTPPAPEKPIVQSVTGGPPLHYFVGGWEASFEWDFGRRPADPEKMRLILTHKSLRLALTREDFQALQSIFIQMKWPVS